MNGQMFKVSVLDGLVLYDARGSAVRLRGLGRSFLGCLVARGASGVSVQHLADQGGTRPAEAAVSACAARLRNHVGREFMPDAHDGVYRLHLPATAVDAWRLSELASHASLGSTSVGELRYLLGDGSIFGPDLQLDVLDDARFRLLGDQRALIARLAREAPALGMKLGHVLLPYVEDEPDNQLLTGLYARALADAGDRRSASQLIDDLGARLRATGYVLDDDLVQFRRDLVSSQPVAAETDARSTGWIGSSDLPSEVWSNLVTQSSDSVQVTLVHAGSGFGKSHVLTSIAALADASEWTVRTAAGRSEMAGRGDLLAQIVGHATAPTAEHVEAVVAQLGDALIAAGRGAPVLLAVDDAQWLDAASLELLALLTTISLPMQVAVIVAARSDIESPGVSRLAELATNVVELSPLDEDGICELVLDRAPAVGLLAAKNIAGPLTAQSAGIPGIAVLQLPQHLDGTATTGRVHADPLLRIVDGLDDGSQRVGRVAAALGNPVRVDRLEAVAGLDRTELAGALGALERRDLLRRESAVRYELPHALVSQAFAASCSIEEWAEINAAAAEVADSEDRRAHHLYEGLPISDPDQTVDALVTSARHHALVGDAAAASQAFARADEVTPLVSPSDAIAWSRALDLTGFHARANEVRAAHFDRLIDSGDHETALRLAISGQPEAESVDGDLELLGRLRAIDGSALVPSSAWLLAWNTVRQELLSGSGIQGNGLVRVVDLARSADQQVRTALLRRHAIWSESPHARLAVLDECRSMLGEASAAEQAEYRVVRCMDSYEAGSLVGADAELLQLRSIEPLEPRRQWHVRMLGASIASDRGQHDLAERLRSEGQRISIAAGLTDAEFGQLAPLFTDLMLRRELPALLAMIDGGAFDADRRTLMVAVGCQVRAAAGQVERARLLACEVVDQAEREPGLTSAFAVALVSEVLASGAVDCEFRRRAQSMLRPLRGGFLMLGAGATTVGPVDRYRAFLAEGSERHDLLVAARDAAKLAGAVRWEAVTERDLFEATGNDEHQQRFEAIRSTLPAGSLGS